MSGTFHDRPVDVPPFGWGSLVDPLHYVLGPSYGCRFWDSVLSLVRELREQLTDREKVYMKENKD